MKIIRGLKISRQMSVLLATLAWFTSAVAAYPVAGLAPHQRPAGAPAVAATMPEANALHGVTKPTPESVNKFMKDQGNWHTPFTRPGMPGPYDIRGWHSSPPASGKH
jgi:hypothetical protein